MSDEDKNKDLGDDLNDMLGDAKEGAKKAADKAEDKAKEMADDAKEFGKDAKEKASKFADEAKETAKEFTAGAKETFQSNDNKKILAGILGILLGGLGVHKFILGYTKEGIIMLALALLGFFTCGITSAVSGIIGLIEGILYLTKSDEDFYNTYQVGQKPWF